MRCFLSTGLLLALLAVTGCSASDATGRRFFNGGLTPDREQAIGREQHPQMIEAFGGHYNEKPDLNRYVQSLGDFLVQTSETPDQNFTFTLLDTPVVNAFALPGGYVYITRGLLALANSEAELAGVLAHEIGHVTARHAAEHHGSQVLAQILSVGVGLLTQTVTGNRPVAEAVTRTSGTVGQLAVRSFSRDQEFEADLLGVRYLTRARFDPQAMAHFLARLRAHAAIETRKDDSSPGFDLTRTHPRTAERIQRAIAQAGLTPVACPTIASALYLNKTDGLLYGDSAAQGFIRGQRFSHPQLGITFTAPPGFRLTNHPHSVTATTAETTVVFDNAERQVASEGLRDYLVNDWGKGHDLDGVETLTVNGLAGYTATIAQSDRFLRLIVIAMPDHRLYRFLIVTPQQPTGQLSEDLKRMTYSFRALNATERAALKPLRLRLSRVRPGEGLDSLVDRMAPIPDARARFLLLNGLDEEAVLTAGEQVRLVGD